MNFYNSLKSAPMQMNHYCDLETLVMCAEGKWTGLRPQFVTPCIQRFEPLSRITSQMECHELHYTGFVMLELWSYNSAMLTHAIQLMQHDAQLEFILAAIPQPRRNSLFVLVYAEVHNHAEYVAAHHVLREKLAMLLPPQLHIRPNLGNETDPTGDTFAHWNRICQEAARRYHLTIHVSTHLERTATPDEKERKIDIADRFFLT